MNLVIQSFAKKKIENSAITCISLQFLKKLKVPVVSIKEICVPNDHGPNPMIMKQQNKSHFTAYIIQNSLTISKLMHIQ